MKIVKRENRKVSDTTSDVLRRKCVEWGKIFESNAIKCPSCKSKKTTCSFKEN